MEFVAGPAVHRVLCADCGMILSFARVIVSDFGVQVPPSCPILPIYVLHVFEIRTRRTFVCLRIILIYCSVDITEGIPKQGASTEPILSFTPVNIISLASVSFCRNCERFLAPPTSWTLAKPESAELLSICLKKLKGLNKVRLTEAHFIWTEPHSKRLRVSMTIQKEVRRTNNVKTFTSDRHQGSNEHYIGANF